MKTTYYTFDAWNDSAMAAGFDSSLDKGGRSAPARRLEQSGRGPVRDNVIDLAAWRMENLEQSQNGPDELEEPDWEAAAPARRPRKSHRAMVMAELTSTISVAAALAALTIRVLMF